MDLFSLFRIFSSHSNLVCYLSEIFVVFFSTLRCLMRAHHSRADNGRGRSRYGAIFFCIYIKKLLAMKHWIRLSWARSAIPNSNQSKTPFRQTGKAQLFYAHAHARRSQLHSVHYVCAIIHSILSYHHFKFESTRQKNKHIILRCAAV